MKPETLFARRSSGHSALMATISGLAVLLLGLASAQAYTMVWEYNNFDTDLGNWTLQNNNFAGGNNFDWRNSSLAGGTAGEIGGRVADSSQLVLFGRLLDFTIDLNTEMWFRGKVSVSNPEAWVNGSGQDLNVGVGYWNSADPDNQKVTWRTLTPSATGGTTDPYRGRGRMPSINGGSAVNLTQGTSYNFEVHWTPSGLNDFAGTFSGFVGTGTPWSVAVGSNPTWTFDTFGLFWGAEATQTAGLNYYMYLDNFEYLVPVPEPSAGLLAGLGILGLWLGRRVRFSRAS